jgi:hypothetical protein
MLMGEYHLIDGEGGDSILRATTSWNEATYTSLPCTRFASWDELAVGMYDKVTQIRHRFLVTSMGSVSNVEQRASDHTFCA